jgi:hypothetical protein
MSGLSKDVKERMEIISTERHEGDLAGYRVPGYMSQRHSPNPLGPGIRHVPDYLDYME